MNNLQNKVDEMLFIFISRETIENSRGNEHRGSISKEKFSSSHWLYSNEFFHSKSNMELVMAVAECKVCISMSN